jgi:K+-transporting ATPase KdpF subunit
MKTKFALTIMPLAVVTVHPGEAVSGSHTSYLIGGIIALLILGYLIYTLLHPDKF